MEASSLDLASGVRAALDAPAGSRPELLDPALLAVLRGTLTPRRFDAAGRSWDLGLPADADALLRHLGGATWAPALVRLEESAMALDPLLALGFRDAPLDALEAFTQRNDIPTARILSARDDAPDALLALSRRHPERLRVRHSALAAALARMEAIPPGLEDDLALWHVGHAPLGRDALRSLGAERAGAVVLRAMRRSDGEPEFQPGAVVVCLETFGGPLDAATLDALAARIELLSTGPGSYLWWEEVGSRLDAADAFEPALDFVRGRMRSATDATLAAGWRRVLRVLLDRRVRRGAALDPCFDADIDPAGAARLTHDVWQATLRLLSSISPERAERVLAAATYDHPADILRFLLPGMSPAYLERVAAALVSLRDDPSQKHMLVATSLRPLGPGFVDALKVALAAVKPKRALLSALERNLDPADFAALSTWLAERPEPKKPKGTSKGQ